MQRCSKIAVLKDFPYSHLRTAASRCTSMTSHKHHRSACSAEASRPGCSTSRDIQETLWPTSHKRAIKKLRLQDAVPSVAKVINVRFWVENGHRHGIKGAVSVRPSADRTVRPADPEPSENHRLIIATSSSCIVHAALTPPDCSTGCRNDPGEPGKWRRTR